MFITIIISSIINSGSSSSIIQELYDTFHTYTFFQDLQSSEVEEADNNYEVY